MARAATTADAFNAVAEPRRREILDALARGERSVTDLVEQLGVAQPVVSKHLRVLREVGLVRVRDEGRQRIYRLDPAPLREVYEWVRDYERLWNERFDLLDAVLEDLKAQQPEPAGQGSRRTESATPGTSPLISPFISPAGTPDGTTDETPNQTTDKEHES